LHSSGLGNMGSAMATNLIKAGHTLTVFNRSRARPFFLIRAHPRLSAVELLILLPIFLISENQW